VVKTTAPGVPDFYQGTELWDLSMVDPDNRRAVDFAGGSARSTSCCATTPPAAPTVPRRCWPAPTTVASSCGSRPCCCARARRERELFAHGSYIPLLVEGARRDNVVAFARRWQGRVAVTITGRFFTQLPADGLGEAWQDTTVVMPPEVPIRAFSTS